MGSTTSKPTEMPKTQTWTSETPVRFSQGLVDSLQASPETDSTRAKTLELHIQNRVTEELRRLQSSTAKEFTELTQKLSEPDTTPIPKKEGDQSAGDKLRELGRQAVENDVKELKRKLEDRKRVRDTDQGVEKAKEEVVKCLRGNDRRPLDCWREVETFRNEVRRLEGEWVEKVVR